MRLLLTSILVSLMFAGGCSKKDDDTATGESMLDKAKTAVDSTTEKAGDMASDAADATKEAGKVALDKAGDVAQDTADALHEAAGTAEDTAQDAAKDAADAMKEAQQ